MSQDRTFLLQPLMQRAGFASFRALSQAAGISEKQLRQLRRGDLTSLRLEIFLKLSQALQLSVTDLLGLFAPSPKPSGSLPMPLKESQAAEKLQQSLTDLQQEYARLQETLNQQRTALWQEFQQLSLQTLESLLLQLPTAAYAAQQNPQAPAVKLLPLLRPLDHLLQAWEVEPIAPVGAEVAYNPQQHQLMEGTAQVGDRVRVRYTGYRQGEKLLYRAKVSPVSQPTSGLSTFS